MSGAPTWRAVSADAVERLRAAGLPAPETDVRRMVEQASGWEGAEYVVGLDEAVTALTLASFERMLDRRCTGEPLQYVLGSWGFRQLDLLVDRRVLIPRPETEVVTEVALIELDRLRRAGGHRRMVLVDLGTGSGAIGLSVAAERDRVDVWATDASDEALAVARANLAGLGRRGSAVRLARGDWFAALPEELAGTVDVVVSNPPYVAEGDELPAEVGDWEPEAALVAGPTGYECLHQILDAAPRWLCPDGALVVEIAPGQAAALTRTVEEAGWGAARVEPDLAGRPRVLVAGGPPSALSP